MFLGFRVFRIFKLAWYRDTYTHLHSGVCFDGYAKLLP